MPVKTVDKTSTHTAKRNTDGAAPSKAPVTGGNRRGGAISGNEGGASFIFFINYGSASSSRFLLTIY